MIQILTGCQPAPGTDFFEVYHDLEGPVFDEFERWEVIAEKSKQQGLLNDYYIHIIYSNK